MAWTSLFSRDRLPASPEAAAYFRSSLNAWFQELVLKP